jgi:hypothetical protein
MLVKTEPPVYRTLVLYTGLRGAGLREAFLTGARPLGYSTPYCTHPVRRPRRAWPAVPPRGHREVRCKTGTVPPL